MLKLQYFGHLMWKANSLEKILMLGKIESRRRRGWQRMRWLDSNTDTVDMNLSKPWVIVKDRGAWWAAVHGSQRVRHNVSRCSMISLHLPVRNSLWPRFARNLKSVHRPLTPPSFCSGTWSRAWACNRPYKDRKSSFTLIFNSKANGQEAHPGGEE